MGISLARGPWNYEVAWYCSVCECDVFLPFSASGHEGYDLIESGEYRFERNCVGDRRVEEYFAAYRGELVNSDSWLRNEEETSAVRAFEKSKNADVDLSKVVEIYEILSRGGSYTAELNRIRILLTVDGYGSERSSAIGLLKKYESLGSETAKLYLALYFLENLDKHPSVNSTDQLDRMRVVASCSDLAKIAYAQYAARILDTATPEWGEAIHMLESQAGNGITSSGVILGQVLYERSKKSAKKLYALRYILEAAENGDSLALSWLGHKIRSDAFVVSEARALVEAAALSGNTKLSLHLAHANNFGGAMQSSPEVVVKWFKNAADGGDPEGQFNYALALLRGWGVDKDVAEARKAIESAAEAGYSPAKNWLIEHLSD